MSYNRFLMCRHCGNVVGIIEDSGVPVCCCGEPMEKPRTESMNQDMPETVKKENRVCIEFEPDRVKWVYLQTDRGGQRKEAMPGSGKITFTVDEEKPVALYAYSEHHGLYEREI